MSPVFGAYVLLTLAFQPGSSWAAAVNAAQFKGETMKVAGTLLLMGVLHGVNLLILLGLEPALAEPVSHFVESLNCWSMACLAATIGLGIGRLHVPNRDRLSCGSDRRLRGASTRTRSGLAHLVLHSQQKPVRP